MWDSDLEAIKQRIDEMEAAGTLPRTIDMGRIYHIERTSATDTMRWSLGRSRIIEQCDETLRKFDFDKLLTTTHLVRVVA